MRTKSKVHRLLCHLLMGRLQQRKLFPSSVHEVVTAAVKKAEEGHSGQIRVVVEVRRPLQKILGGESAKERALEIFGSERVWDTEKNNGVLLYLSLADRDAEIVADRGFNGLVSSERWSVACSKLEQMVGAHGVCAALCSAIAEIGSIVVGVYPSDPLARTTNELPDTVIVR